MSRPEILIIGGGVIGLAIAWRLHKRGAKVSLVDSGAPSATMASAGMLAPSFEPGAGALGEALYAFAMKSLRLWADFAAELEAESGEAIDYRADGVLGVAYAGDSAKALDARASALEARGAPVERLSGAEARRLEPALGEEVACALHAPADGQVDARRLLHALERALARRGVAVTKGEKAAFVEPQGDGLRVVLEHGAPRLADIVVLANGAAAASVRTPAPRPPVFPVKGEALALLMAEPALGRVIRAPGAYLCPKADGRLVVGASEVAHDHSLVPSDAAIAALRESAARAVPQLANFREAERWAGSRPGTPDGAPILGAAPNEARLFYALGHFRNGVLLAPATAEALAARILGESAAAEIAPFGAARFAP
jgi:glycine oxidase